MGIDDDKKLSVTSGSCSVEFAVVSGNFPDSGVILPLGSRRLRAAALREFYFHKNRNIWNKAKIISLRLFNFAFIWRIIFRKRLTIEKLPISADFLSFFESRLGLSEPIIFSIYIGSRKYILPIFGEKSGKMLGVAKIYLRGKESSDYGENEAKILDILKEADIRGFSFPRVLAADYFDGHFVLILSSILNHKNEVSVTKNHLDFLKEVSGKMSSKILFSSSGFFAQFERQLGFIQSKMPQGFGLIDNFCKSSFKDLRDKELIFSLTKREFPFFEMTRSGGELFVIDWEQSRMEFPPIFDLFGLLISAGRFRKGDYIVIYKKNIKDIFFNNNLGAKNILEEMADFWRLGSGDVYALFILFLVDQLYIHLHTDHQESARRIVSFFEEMSRNEAFFRTNWLLGGSGA